MGTWIPIVISGISMLIGVMAYYHSRTAVKTQAAIAVAVVKEQIVTLQKGDAAMSQELKEAVAGFSRMMTDFNAMHSAQAQINLVTERAIEGIVRRMEKQDERDGLQDHAITELMATNKLLNELLRSKGILG